MDSLDLLTTDLTEVEMHAIDSLADLRVKLSTILDAHFSGAFPIPETFNYED